MNGLYKIIALIKEKRKTLASVFLISGLLNSTLFITILLQKPQDVRTQASESFNDTEVLTTFVSPKGRYHVWYNQTLWIPKVQEDAIFGTRVVFYLNNEYGTGKLDIIEGESEKDLDSLKDELIKTLGSPPFSVNKKMFQDKPSYEMVFQEEILGESTFYSKEIVKNETTFLIIEKRAPQLNNNDSFVNNLLQSISFAGTKRQETKGVSNVSTDLTLTELVDLVRPSIVHIVHSYCLEVSNLKPVFSGLSKARYSFCTAGKGSGFIVNEDGVLATNGHVAKVYPEEALVENLLYEGNKPFSYDLISGMYLSKGQNPKQNQVDDFYRELILEPHHFDRLLSEVFQLIEKEAIALNITNERFFVDIGKTPMEVDYQKLQMGDYANAIIPSATTYTAKFVDTNYANKYSFDAITKKNYRRGPDVALLQIDTSSTIAFPALTLGSIENRREGTEIVVAGYPTLVEGEKDPRAALSYKTSTKPTITRGIISAIKEDLSGRTVLQTDASIDHGNSGGPAIDELGQVLGIATFAVESQSGNFNFIRDVAELRELMSKNNIDNELASVSNGWRNGLQSFRSKRYNEAIKYFIEVKNANPDHPTVNEFIQFSKDAIQRGESVEGLTGFMKSSTAHNALLVVFGTLSIASFISSGFLMALPLFEV